MTLGEKIKELRLKTLTTQRELAHILCIGEGYLSKIENDKKPLRREDLKELANFFEIPVKELEVLWLSTKIYTMLKDEKHGLAALSVAEAELLADQKMKSNK